MRKYSGLVAAMVLVFAGALPAGATGVVHIQPKNGPVKTYAGVKIALDSASMALTSSDGVGTLYVGRAACTTVGQLIKCAPYDATYIAKGVSTHIALVGGNAWLNPSKSAHPIPDSKSVLPPRGVVMTIHSKAGTTVTLSGTADVIQK